MLEPSKGVCVDVASTGSEDGGGEGLGLRYVAARELTAGPPALEGLLPADPSPRTHPAGQNAGGGEAGPSPAPPGGPGRAGQATPTSAGQNAPERVRPARQGKVAGGPRNQMGWFRLTQASTDLSGLCGSGPVPVSMRELAMHCTPEDCWVALDGAVYNVTKYVAYHPGGAKVLLDVGGQDASDLFRKFHAWVNHRVLLQKCLVGPLTQ